EIVDHQVHHDVDVQASRSEDAKAMCFEKPRMSCDPRGGRDGGIESFEMANLQNRAAASCCVDDQIGFIKRSGYGFLNEYCYSGIQQVSGDRRVRFGRNGNADDVRQSDELAMVRDERGAVAFSQWASARLIDIAYRDKLSGFAFEIDSRVFAAECARACNRNSYH